MGPMLSSIRFRLHASRFNCSMNRLFLVAITIGSLLSPTSADDLGLAKREWRAAGIGKRVPPAKRGPPEDGEDKVPLVVTNKCEATIWPGLATQAGTGPGTGGFELEPGKNKTMWVGSNWQGRIWGRTNCTVNGESCACKTGDCFAKLNCEFSVCLKSSRPCSPPVY